ncbi:uncharacterized protein K452DRAFT_287230 [Aplosporella prunicola CBS 121167]|uniref:Carboxymuconolactone decarboxylase-like domain-containing protein n=1 Tax=Aplosporella prunicola CBS 121167 TaxID=1176127 RepID=A0A6A6BF72_9PEZI|nr:uncharacterized protein K452DRAFT_287230 [Aplosporella prunicola CBS 121167]KAF2142033.1 hypothetical protein K452DRAFT_287230 [Aplosporella prunicola CBS 121167]
MPPLNLPTILTPALVHSIRSQPHLPRHVWYYVTGVTLSALNRPDEVPKVLAYALENGAEAPTTTSAPTPTAAPERHERSATTTTAAVAEDAAEQLRIARRMREGLVKSAAVLGVPKAINALLALKAMTPEYLLDEAGAPSPTQRRAEMYDTPPTEILGRGQRYFERVYGKVARRVMGQMDRSGTEDLGLTGRLVYGYLLSNERVLDARDSSFVLVAALIPQDVNPQLKGHLRGALNNGATADEVRAVREIVIRICEASGMRMLEAEAPGGWGWREEIANV